MSDIFKTPNYKVNYSIYSLNSFVKELDRIPRTSTRVDLESKIEYI